MGEHFGEKLTKDAAAVSPKPHLRQNARQGSGFYGAPNARGARR
jgi:hypothetical protein